MTGAVVVIDQATKQLVVHSLERGDKTKFFIGIDLTY
ncbi:MAG: hypothetical protein QOG41_725, partial [Thermoleophilaceae bacterium]|nr:hypothetical protein [Thermoleophilaceae bacterium]